jgi:hypothetical protein
MNIETLKKYLNCIRRAFGPLHKQQQSNKCVATFFLFENIRTIKIVLKEKKYHYQLD